MPIAAILAVGIAVGIAAKHEKAAPQSPTKIRMPVRTRIYVKPESVGYEKDCPLPTVKNPISFECPMCGLKMKTHLLYPFLPHCPKDKSVMNEIEKW